MFLRFHLFVNWVFSWHGYLSLHLCHGDWQSEVCLCSSFLLVLAHRWKELGNFTNDGLSYSCSLLTFLWFQGNRNLVSDPLKLLFPQTIVIMSEIHCEFLLSWYSYLCLLSWIIAMAYLDKGTANQNVSQVAFRIFLESFVVLGICLEQVLVMPGCGFKLYVPFT